MAYSAYRFVSPVSIRIVAGAECYPRMQGWDDESSASFLYIVSDGVLEYGTRSVALHFVRFTRTVQRISQLSAKLADLLSAANGTGLLNIAGPRTHALRHKNDAKLPSNSTSGPSSRIRHNGNLITPNEVSAFNRVVYPITSMGHPPASDYSGRLP